MNKKRFLDLLARYIGDGFEDLEIVGKYGSICCFNVYEDSYLIGCDFIVINNTWVVDFAEIEEIVI